MVRKLSFALALACTIVPALASASDPKVPPAKDPALAPVALVGAGIDYTDMAIAQRLARDGEGNIVGWDFVDNDIFPYAKDAATNAQAKLLLANPGVELVPVRVGAGDYKGVGAAASFLSRTPVRVVVVMLTSAKKEDWVIFTKAAQIFNKLLFVVPAGETAPLYPEALNLENVISVGTPLAKNQSANVAMAVSSGSTAGGGPDAAISLAAALATCHASAIAGGDGKAMKAAVIAMAKIRSAAFVPAVEPCP